MEDILALVSSIAPSEKEKMIELLKRRKLKWRIKLSSKSNGKLSCY